MASGTLYFKEVPFQYFTSSGKVVVVHQKDEKSKPITLKVSIPYNNERGVNLRAIIIRAIEQDKTALEIVSDYNEDTEQEDKEDN